MAGVVYDSRIKQKLSHHNSLANTDYDKLPKVKQFCWREKVSSFGSPLSLQGLKDNFVLRHQQNVARWHHQDSDTTLR